MTDEQKAKEEEIALAIAVLSGFDADLAGKLCDLIEEEAENCKTQENKCGFGN